MSNDEFVLETAPFKTFVSRVNEVVAREPSAERAIAALREPFAALLRDDTWLPEELATVPKRSGMGGDIGSYLLYRKTDQSLSISSLVVGAGALTPIHDHLAWGLVGLYRGEQSEEVYRWRGKLELAERRHLKAGDFYELLPPEGDIHRVLAADAQPSVSIHLLGNDVGCVHRHQYETETMKPFRSGYVNVECKE